MNFLITGGCGYIGTKLTQHLLLKKNKVTIIDNCWFGNYHKENKSLKVIKEDIRNLMKSHFPTIKDICKMEYLTTFMVFVCHY